MLVLCAGMACAQDAPQPASQPGTPQPANPPANQPARQPAIRPATGPQIKPVPGVPGVKETKEPDYLPKHVYTIPCKPSELVSNDAAFAEFIVKVKADAQADLKLEIKEGAAKQRRLVMLQQIAIFENRDDDATALIDPIRAVETRSDRKLLTGLILSSWVQAKKDTAADSAKFKDTFEAELNRRTLALDYPIVRNELTRIILPSTQVPAALAIKRLADSFDDQAQKDNNTITGDAVAQVLAVRYFVKVMTPINASVRTVLEAVAVGQHQHDIRDREHQRSLAMAKNNQVVVAVWDAGVDTEIFKKFLWINDREELNGRDDDGNGFVDDLYGIGFDTLGRADRELCYTPYRFNSDGFMAEAAAKGMLDRRLGLKTPDADALDAMLGKQGFDATAFEEDTSRWIDAHHGAFLASAMLGANKAGRLLTVRVPFSHPARPTKAPSVEDYKDLAGTFARSCEYMQDNGVRVAVIGWNVSVRDLERQLKFSDVPAEQQAALAKAIVRGVRGQLNAALKLAPDVLFVCPVENAPQDMETSAPACADAPNLLRVGAATKDGKPCPWTTDEPKVAFFAQGVLVSGDATRFGASHFNGAFGASAVVAHKALDLLSENAKRTVPELIDAIRATGTPMEGHDGAVFISGAAEAPVLKTQIQAPASK